MRKANPRVFSNRIAIKRLSRINQDPISVLSHGHRPDSHHHRSHPLAGPQIKLNECSDDSVLRYNDHVHSGWTG